MLQWREVSGTGGRKPYVTEGTRQKPPALGLQGKAHHYRGALVRFYHGRKLFFFSPLHILFKIFHFLTFHSAPVQRRPSIDTTGRSAVDVPGLFAVMGCLADELGCIVSNWVRELGTNHTGLKKKYAHAYF